MMENNGKDNLVNIVIVSVTAIVCVVLSLAIYTTRMGPKSQADPAIYQDQQLIGQCELAKKLIADSHKPGPSRTKVLGICQVHLDSNPSDWEIVHYFYILQEIKAVKQLNSYCSDSDVRKRYAAAVALGHLQDKNARTLLVKLADDDTLVKMEYPLPATPADAYVYSHKTIHSNIATAAKIALKAIQ
ncbi:MAG: hypothetical protein JEZ07_10450 [Phycisphaerae bacterium]|nr:hypothetical protein [Phycisphaerae bacterium]